MLGDDLRNLRPQRDWKIEPIRRSGLGRPESEHGALDQERAAMYYDDANLSVTDRTTAMDETIERILGGDAVHFIGDGGVMHITLPHEVTMAVRMQMIGGTRFAKALKEALERMLSSVHAKNLSPAVKDGRAAASRSSEFIKSNFNDCSVNMTSQRNRRWCTLPITSRHTAP